MQYRDSKDSLDTARKILKVDHAGEFGAINIYRAQILVCRLFHPRYVSLLKQFLEDEKRHLDIFWQEIQKRGGPKCKSYWLCGIGGFATGFVCALLGKKGIMACTLAVESVVTEHLISQLDYLKSINDIAAYNAVEAIINDEAHHRDIGQAEGGDNSWFAPLRVFIRFSTEIVIRFGMR